MHQQREIEKKQNKDMDIAIANLRNKRKAEVEQRLMSLEV